MAKEKKVTILTVEDDASMRELLKKVLEKNDYRVLEAKDGKEALALVKNHPEISLVLSDIRMPKMNGMSLLEKIVDSKSKLKVILITAFGEVEQYLDAMNTGAFEYLNKPFENQELLDVVKRALETEKP